MSGFEVAGLVLGAIPLLISAIEHYETIVASVSKYRKFSSKVRDMHDTLILERTIFRAECVLLLATDISKSEAESMLRTPSHPLWRNEAFHNRMSRCFGSLGNAMTEVAGSMVNALGRIALKITELGHVTGDTSVNAQQSNAQWRASVKTKLKFALSSQASISKDLKMLTKLNERFTMLSSQVRQLESLYSTPKPEAESQIPSIEGVSNFARTRTASLDLYDALLQACPADHEHFLRLGLNGISIQEGKLAAESKIRFDVQYRDHCKPGPQNDPKSAGDTSSYRLLIDCSAAFDSTTSFAAAQVEPPTEPTRSATASGKRPATSSNKQAVVSLQDNDLCQQLSDIAHSSQSSKQLSQMLVLPGTGSFQHAIVSSRSSVWNCQMTSLASVLFQIKDQGRNFEIPQFQRLSIAETLGTTVLQMYDTPWLARTLHSYELYFPGGSVDAPDITRLGYTAFEPDTMYMDVRLEAQYTTSLMQMPAAGQVIAGAPQQSRFGLQTGPPNRWLYHLGILLIELAYHTPFTDLVIEMRRDYDALSIPLSSNPSTAEYQIACQLAESVGSTLGASYAGIVRRCLRCDFNVASSDLDNNKLQQSVYENVVCKLKDLSRAFKTLQVASVTENSTRTQSPASSTKQIQVTPEHSGSKSVTSKFTRSYYEKYLS